MSVRPAGRAAAARRARARCPLPGPGPAACPPSGPRVRCSGSFPHPSSAPGEPARPLNPAFFPAARPCADPDSGRGEFTLETVEGPAALPKTSEFAPNSCGAVGALGWLSRS